MLNQIKTNIRFLGFHKTSDLSSLHLTATVSTLLSATLNSSYQHSDLTNRAIGSFGEGEPLGMKTKVECRPELPLTDGPRRVAVPEFAPGSDEKRLCGVSLAG